MENIKYSISGHESFYIREGWLTKGLEFIKEAQMNNSSDNPFSNNSIIDTIDELGLGVNMVKSLKFWLETFNLVSKGMLTRHAEIIYDKDKYIQKKETLWLLHYYISSVQDNSVFIVWRAISERLTKVFSKENIISDMELMLDKPVSLKTLESNFNVYINTYYSSKYESKDPENNIVSPFVKLKYLQFDDKTGDYKFRNVSYEEINPYIALLIFQGCMGEIQLIEFSKLFEYFRKYVKMDAYDFNLLLKRMQGLNLLTIDYAAGLNNIVIKKLDELEILGKIYE